MASKCALCARSRVGRFKTFSCWKSVVVKGFCQKAKVPDDVLFSNANCHSGESSALFKSDEVQQFLKKLTGLNLGKVFASRREELSNPVYKVLDEEQLKEDEEKVVQKAAVLLKMASVMSRRKPIQVVLSKDEEVIGHDVDGSSYVFTDISPSKDLRNRSINVRENDTGILREATWDERDRMQYMYWPKEGQLHEIPPMLQDEHLPRVFAQLRHNDILDLLNVQCEPDAPDYIRVHQRVYNDLDERQQYDILHSTRHYGGMVFYFINNKKINRLLGYYIRSNRLPEAIDLVKLHSLIHGELQTFDEADDTGLLTIYLTQEGLHDLLAIVQEDNENITQQL